MLCDDVDYDSVSVNIPHVIQSLYLDDVLNSTTLTEFRDAFRINQMQGKAWLLDQLKTVDRETPILIIGSWMGFISYCLYKMGFKYITETDPDSRLSTLAIHVNRNNPHFKHLNLDVNQIDITPYRLIINTSCEHIGDNTWFNNIHQDCLIALQSTNLPWHDHVNTVDSVEEMKSKYPMNYTYADELIFNPKYTRFMLVGKKYNV